MHVLMLGWEFPPYITGGLGTACFGLTRAMDRRGLRVTFVLPQAVSEDFSGHVRLLSPDSGRRAGAIDPVSERSILETGEQDDAESATGHRGAETGQVFEHVDFIAVPSAIRSPYLATTTGGAARQRQAGSTAATNPEPAGDVADAPGVSPREADLLSSPPPPPGAGPPGQVTYDGNVISQVERYARFCLAATRRLKFDIIHAHDWLTFPAGLWIARATGRPLVVHVHSTEFDRSGIHVNQRIYDIERRGMHGAMKVVAVSRLTKSTIIQRYSVPAERIEVVYNGVDLEPRQVGMTGIQRKDKIVLYFGRITFQKGPEYFIRAARRVLEVMDDVKFVVAGSGDMAQRMIEMAAETGIGHKVLFTGFLRGRDIDRVFALADLYVMPSVSEPFGIAPLEAMSHSVPVLISKSSGVSEVLSHALKVDFWDTDDMANKIVAVLRHPPLSQTLQEHGQFEVRQLTWDGAAHRCEQIYQGVLRSVKHHPHVNV